MRSAPTTMRRSFSITETLSSALSMRRAICCGRGTCGAQSSILPTSRSELGGEVMMKRNWGCRRRFGHIRRGYFGFVRCLLPVGAQGSVRRARYCYNMADSADAQVHDSQNLRASIPNTPRRMPSGGRRVNARLHAMTFITNTKESGWLQTADASLWGRRK